MKGSRPNNAKRFVHLLESLLSQDFEGISYAVFGCGHYDCQSTFQRIPTFVDELMEKIGVKQICSKSSFDAAQGDTFNDFDSWEENVFWPTITKQYGGIADAEPEECLSIQMSSQHRSELLHQDVQQALVVDTNLLTAKNVPTKRNIERSLPPDTTYRIGDYLAISPMKSC